MYIFLSTFFFLYALIHYFFYVKLRETVTLSTSFKFLVVAVLIIFIFSPMLVRLLERAEFFIIGRILAFIGYIWMAFIFLFFSVSILLLLIKTIGRISFNDFYISLFISITLVAYGIIEAKNISVEKIKIYTDKIKKDKIIRVVQISDVHLGIILKDGFAKKVSHIIKDLAPDILVSTGDFVDGQSNDISYLSEYFENIKPPMGKYAILGNHEFYVGLKNSLSFLERSGFIVLRNKSVTPTEGIILVGVDDDTVRHYEPDKYFDETLLFRDLNKNNFIIYLKHKPKVEKDLLNLFDLQLSGHTHRGQIFPFTFIVKIFFPAKSGLSVYEKGGGISYLYNSRGTGTWGPPVRFLSKPEVTLIEIIGK